MTSVTAARLRGFGETGADGFYRWPLDRARDLGLSTVPGFVAEFGPGALVPGKGAAHAAFAGGFADRLGSRPGGVRVTVRWWSSRTIRGVARLLPLLDLRAEPRPLEAKRFVERFAVDAAGLAEPPFERAEHAALTEHGRARDRDLPETVLWTLVAGAKDRYARRTGVPFPETVAEQFAVIAEHLQRAAPGPDVRISCCVRRDYPEGTPGLLGSVRIHSRDPRSGAARCHAHLLPNRPPQELTWGDGADAVPLPDGAAPDTPTWLSDRVRRAWRALASAAPGRIVRLDAVVVGDELLADDYALVDEPASARVGIAAEAAREPDAGLWRAALARLTRADLDLILTPRLDSAGSPADASLARGTGVAAGACSGVLCTTPDAAVRHRRRGRPVIYVADSPDPQHIAGIMVADGLVFARGGVTSHVAVIARGTGRPCVMGAGAVAVDTDSGVVRFGERRVREGATISVDGTSGAVYAGQVALLHPAPGAFEALRTVLDRCDAEAGLTVFANADTAEDAETAFRNGAHGIGLCRLEHLLGGSPHLPSLQEALVLAVATAPRAAVRARAVRALDRWGPCGGALASLAEATRSLDQDPSYDRYRRALVGLGEGIVAELHAILRAARGRTVVVRLLDAPGSEFLQPDDAGFAARTGLPDGDYRRAVARLTGADPALGLRGARLCVLAPEFTAAQVDAIMTAAVRAADDGAGGDGPVRVDVMVPFVSAPSELAALRDLAERTVAGRVGADRRVTTRFGVMVETPRAALLAGELTHVADFLSFGTNDLTQFTWACSRDSAEGAFLGYGLYRDLHFAPFDRFDEAGLGSLIALAVRRARDAAPGIPIGVCGELGADPDAMAFFSRIGIDHVSCAPLRVTGARLTAAQRTPPPPSPDQVSADGTATTGGRRPCASLRWRPGAARAFGRICRV